MKAETGVERDPQVDHLKRRLHRLSPPDFRRVEYLVDELLADRDVHD